MAEKLSDIDPTYHARLLELQAHLLEVAQKHQQGLGAPWYKPEGVTAGPEDTQRTQKAFDRTQLNATYEKLLTTTTPGREGDLIVLALQVDQLALLERAYLARHGMSYPRAVCHSLGRMDGQGKDNGALAVRWLNYLTSLLQATAGGP